MKKIMWICNTPLPEIRNELGIQVYGESWLQGISDQLRRREDIEFHYIFPQRRKRGIYKKCVDHIFFWGFYDNFGKEYEISEERKKLLYKIIREVNPNIIHIFGTEFAHSLECMQCVADRGKVIISLQGLISELARVYTKKVPIREQFLQIGKADSLLKTKVSFYRRGMNEKKLLREAVNIIGRTNWDRQCVKKQNAACRYFYCSETLREPFYEGNWNINQIERNSIYISQANYPIKGFHVFLEALSNVLKDYPNAQVYVAGGKTFLQSGDAYGKYINQLMELYGIKNRIKFLGVLPAKKVKEQLLRSHLTVMPSLLENSPNSIGEALMLGTPVVAAKVGGIPSLVRHEKEALLYSNHSAKRLAECIKRVFESDELALKLSKTGRKRAEKLYDRKANLEQLLKIYDAVETGAHEEY